MGPIITFSRQEIKNMREPKTKGEMCTRAVRQSTGELRDQYAKSSAHFGRRVVGEIFKPFKNHVGSLRQCTGYGDMLREQPTWSDISSTSYDM